MEPPTRSQSEDIPSISQVIERLIAELSTIEPQNNNNTTGPTTTTTTTWPSQSTQQADIQNQNPFHSLQGSQLSKVKSLMLTLHCLFPNELLLALDILDRKLVRRFVSSKQTEDGDGNAAEYTNTSGSGDDREEIPDSQEEEEVDSLPEQQTSVRDEMFLVLSTSSTTSQSSRRVPEKYYEVRLRAWNCTCPAFVLSAFRNLGNAVEEDVGVREDEDEEMNYYHGDHWLGGTLTRTMSGNSAPPMCKHLLACILATRCAGLFGNGLQERIDVSQTEMAGWAAGWGG
ncbi:hypothetical protein DTO169E5_5549 [Paecilomyces variotii]|nr:hypothetical protein DTO169C6_179 [Paecilomyces variotii]KAJ9236779.1 hypothetical protein DTO169E5_5549 [Paecilomyces variotii]